jgi:methyl-accepting chemotaxis protein/methyl-accepting chemotaxis protein-1 (serine sensor receptor)
VRARLAIGTLGIFVVVVAGIVALFALYYANLQHRRSMEALHALERASTSATEAQVAFKLQVQEWKNTLLRGHDPADYERYRQAMLARSDEVRAALTALAESGPGDENLPARIQEILETHAAMVERYRETLAVFEAGGRKDPRAADVLVRGIDRPIDQALDSLAEQFRAQSDSDLAKSLAGAAERYDDLRRVVLVAHGLGGLLLLALLLTSLRGAARR